MFGATDIVKSSDKEKYRYCDYGIAFDGKGEWSFGNDFTKNVIVFGDDNSSSSHTENLKNDFLISGEWPTFGINGRFDTSEKKIDINFSKAKTKFSLGLHLNSVNSYLFVNGKEIYKFWANNGNVSFPPRFCLGSISNEFDHVDSKEVFFKGNVYDFSVDNSAIDESNILSIHKYLMVKNNI